MQSAALFAPSGSQLRSSFSKNVGNFFRRSKNKQFQETPVFFVSVRTATTVKRVYLFCLFWPADLLCSRAAGGFQIERYFQTVYPCISPNTIDPIPLQAPRSQRSRGPGPERQVRLRRVLPSADNGSISGTFGWSDDSYSPPTLLVEARKKTTLNQVRLKIRGFFFFKEAGRGRGGCSAA